MAGVNVFEPIANVFVNTSQSWGGVAGQLTAAVLAPITLGASILVIWHGVAILRGAGGGHHVLDVFVKCLRAFLVVALALTAGAYTSTIIGFLQDLRTSLTGMFVTGAATSYSALDIAMQQTLDTWDPVWSWASIHIRPLAGDFSGFTAILCWAAMSAAFWIFGAICAINLVLIDVSLALMFALGPMFVACFAFQATARFTDAWLGAVLKYTLTAVVVSAITGLGVGVLEAYAMRVSAAGGQLQYVVAALSALGSSLMLGVLSLRIPALAGDMVGGIGIAISGLSLGKLPLEAAKSIMTKGASVAASAAGGTARVATNAGAYVAGRAVASETGQRLAQSSLGLMAIKAYERASAFSGIMTDSEGGARAAYQHGRGSSEGTGTATGRPYGKMHIPGGG
jgi:type IV secretion system protein VirB6